MPAASSHLRRKAGPHCGASLVVSTAGFFVCRVVRGLYGAPADGEGAFHG